MAAKLPMHFGAYALLKSLGQGAMGDIHLARPYNARRGIPTPIVIKRLHGELATNPDFVRRFQHEAEIAVSVDSPHVAKVYDVGAVGETLYIAMEHVNGWPLSKFIEAVIGSGRHASIGAIVDMMAGGLEGLEALHTARDIRTGKPLGVVHRDISPKNLMVGEDGKMRLIDLGLGKSNVQDWKTRTGVVMGSVGYMPPEQVTANKVDQRADIYAMAAVLFELLALRHYIQRGPIPVMLRNSVAPTFEPPSRFRPDVPHGLDDVIKKSLSIDPQDRHQSAADFLRDMRAVVPDKRSSGNMSQLINELFAGQLPTRAHELQSLLSMPLPELDMDEPEPERTVTYVMAPGVAPVAVGEGPRRHDPNIVPMGSNPGWQSNPGARVASPDEYGQYGQMSPMAEAVFGSSQLQAQAPASVPIWMFAAGILATIAVTGAFMAFVLLPSASDEPPNVVPPQPSSTAVAVAPGIGVVSPVVAAPAPVAAPDAGVAPAHVPAPHRPRPSIQPPSLPPTAAPIGTPPPAKKIEEATIESVRDYANKLMGKVGAAIGKTEDPERKKQLTRMLNDVTMEAMSSNPEQAARRLRQIEGQLDALP